MDPNKHPTNKKGNKTNEKPMNSNKSKTQEDAGQPHGPPYSFGYKLEYTGLLGN